MEKLKIAIIEDEFVIAEDMASLLLKEGYDVVGTYSKGEEALPAIAKLVPDLVLADIRLEGELSGIDVIQELKKTLDAPVIYITANSDRATYEKAKETKPNAFLIKPFMPANLLAAIDLALYNYAEGQVPGEIKRPETLPIDFQTMINQCLFIKVNGKHKKICRHSIRYIKADGSYSTLFTDTDQYTLTQNLSQFIRKTPLPNLLRIHRSYIVNLTKIDSFEDAHVFVGEETIPIGDNYKSEFLEKIHCL